MVGGVGQRFLGDEFGYCCNCHGNLRTPDCQRAWPARGGGPEQRISDDDACRKALFRRFFPDEDGHGILPLLQSESNRLPSFPQVADSQKPRRRVTVSSHSPGGGAKECSVVDW
jgi:hypothetical protein